MRVRHVVTAAAAAFIVLALLGAGCDETVSIGDGEGSPNGEWVLASLTVDSNSVEVPSTGPVGLTIDNSTLRGQSGCNSFSGDISVGGDGSLSWIDVASTEMGCLDSSLSEFESVFQQRVFTTDRWTVADRVLTLSGAGVVAVYVPEPIAVPRPLEETPWTLDTIFSGSGASGTASTPDMSRPAATAVFNGGSITLTSDDCGEFSFPMVYEAGTAGTISTPPNIRIGRPDCADEESNLLVAFFAIMSSSEWRIEANHLTMTGSEGDLVRFKAPN